MRYTILASVVALLVCAAPAAAQSYNVRAVVHARQATPQPPSQPQAVGFRVYTFYESVSLKAERTFGAQFDTSRTEGLGFGGEVLNLWQGVFVRGAFSKATLTDGSRGFVINNTFFPTFVPIEVQIRPVEIGVGWRHALDPAQRIVAYGGMSLLRVKYTETAEFETPQERREATDSGYAFFGGIDALVWRNIFAGAEVQIRTIADALGQDPDSVSAAFSETNLGGTVFRILGGVRW